MAVNEAIDEGLELGIRLEPLYVSTTQRAVLKARYARLAELMRARLAFAGVVEQGLADHAAEGPELEGVGVVAEGALCRHQARVPFCALFSGGGAVGAGLLVLAAMSLARHGARSSAAALVGLLVGFHGAHAAGGGLRERAERAHGDYLFAGGFPDPVRGGWRAGGRLDRAATTATEAAGLVVSCGGWIGAKEIEWRMWVQVQSSQIGRAHV